VNESGKDDIQFIVARENPMKPFQAPERPLNLIALFV
jgi:hypothetical protein